MYFSVRPPLPIGGGVLSYYFLSSVFSSLVSSFFYYFFTYFTYSAFLISVSFCWAYFYFLYCSYFAFFFFYSAYFLFYYYFFFSAWSAVNLSKFFLQLLTMLYSAFFWLTKKSVFLLRKPKTVSKKPSMFPFCWIIDIKMPSNRLSSLIIEGSKFKYKLNDSM